MTAFNVPAHMSKDLQNRGFFQGICIIDTVAVKWCFSGLGHDGDIYTTNEVHRSIIHAMLPLFIYNLSYADRHDEKGWTRQDHDDLVEEQDRLRSEEEIPESEWRQKEYEEYLQDQYEQEEKQRLELGWDRTEAELKEEQDDEEHAARIEYEEEQYRLKMGDKEEQEENKDRVRGQAYEPATEEEQMEALHKWREEEAEEDERHKEWLDQSLANLRIHWAKNQEELDEDPPELTGED